MWCAERAVGLLPELPRSGGKDVGVGGLAPPSEIAEQAGAAAVAHVLQQEVHATTAKVDVGDDSGGDDVDPAH